MQNQPNQPLRAGDLDDATPRPLHRRAPRALRTALGVVACSVLATAAGGVALAQKAAAKKPAPAVPAKKPAPAAAPKAHAAQAPAAHAATVAPHAAPAHAAAASAPAAPTVPLYRGRWTAETPDEMVDLALTRAKAGGADALAGLLVAASLDDRATSGKVEQGLLAIASSNSPVADDARWLALRHAPEPATTWPGWNKLAWDGPADPNGLVKSFAVLGPFQDTGGGGLTRREGPEAPGQSFSDARARYSWGVYDVAWRRTLPSASTPRGLPLDLYISPRTESCTYVASKVTIPGAAGGAAHPVLVHVGASGAVRLLWDGATAAVSDDVEPRLVLDRMTAKIDATPGPHMVGLKVCSSSTPDDGRVRIRFTDEQRHPIAVESSSDLASLHMPASPPDAPAPATAVAKNGKGAPKGGKAAAASAPPAAPALPMAKGVTRVPTSLEKALELTDKASNEELLVASIVRTLGGAENSRSPRAPGLLDHIAGDPSVSPDVLAIAGWVSPFGANRSGWLNLAYARGMSENDRATAGFALRRLAAAHIASRITDWAVATDRMEPLASAKDPEARLVHDMVSNMLGGVGVMRASVEDLLALTKELGDKTPASVWSEIFELTPNDPKTRALAAQHLAAVTPESRDPSWVHAFRAEGQAPLERAAANALAEQTSAEDLIQIGRDLLDAGSYAWAREAFYYATQVGPNRPAAFEGLAAARQAVAAIEKRDGKPISEDPSHATEALARAADLSPGEAPLKAELGFRTASPDDVPTDEHKSGQRMADEKYIVDPKVFLALAKAHPVEKGTIVDRQLHWVRAVTFHADKRVSQMMHYSREIVVEPRTEEDLIEKQIPAEGDHTELLLARVHRKDGTIALPAEQSAGGRSPYIRWPELHTGDVVEVAVRSWTAGPVGRRGDAPFYFIDYVGSIDTHPILYNEVVVDSPEDSPLAIDVLNGKPDRVVDVPEKGRKVTRYIWDNPPSVPDEPLAPNLSESLPVVVGSTFPSWDAFREWYRSAVKGFTEPDDQVRRLAAELTKGKKTRDEKLHALFDFVSDDIRYVNYVSGEWWLPNRPQQLLARRQGDCDDKAMLLITLLKAVGIDATEVLVQTRYTAEPSLLRSTKAAIPVFDHGIAYLPGKNGQPGIWLDATSPQSRLGPLPSMDARTQAMFVDEGPAVIRETPASSPDEHGTDAEWTIKLSPSGAGDLVAKERDTGDAAFSMRCNMQQPDARQQWIEQNIANGWFPTVQVKPGIEFRSDLPRGATELRYEARSDGFARREGGELAVPISETTTLTSQLAPLVKRTLPVVLPARLAPGHQTVTVTIQAPQGYSFADLPPGGDENGGPFGRAHLEFSRPAGRKDTVVVKRSVVFDMSTIPVADYAKWRAWLQRVDGMMHRMVRLVPEQKKGSTVAVNEAPAPKPGVIVSPASFATKR